MLSKKQIEKLANEIEDGEIKTGADIQIFIWIVIALMDIRDQLDRLGGIIIDFKIEIMGDNLNKESEDMMLLRNKRTNEEFGAEAYEDTLAGFLLRALISLGVVEVVPGTDPATAKPAATEQTTAEQTTAEQTAAEKAAAEPAKIELAAAEAAAEAEAEAVAKAAEKTAADNARAKLDPENRKN